MYRSNESKVQAAALQLAVLARFDGPGRVTPDDLDSLVFMARQMLEDGNPTRVLIEGAAEEFKLVWREAQGREDWCQKLRDDVLRIARPDPVDAHRRDIHG